MLDKLELEVMLVGFVLGEKNSLFQEKKTLPSVFEGSNGLSTNGQRWAREDRVAEFLSK